MKMTQIGFDVERGLRWEKEDGQFWKYIPLDLKIMDIGIDGLDTFEIFDDVSVDAGKARPELLEFAEKYNFDPTKHYKACFVNDVAIQAVVDGYKIIYRDQISNTSLKKCVHENEIIGKHRYKGGQVDWFKSGGDVCDVWYGSDESVETATDELEIIEEYVVVD